MKHRFSALVILFSFFLLACNSEPETLSLKEFEELEAKFYVSLCNSNGCEEVDQPLWFVDVGEGLVNNQTISYQGLLEDQVSRVKNLISVFCTDRRCLDSLKKISFASSWVESSSKSVDLIDNSVSYFTFPETGLKSSSSKFDITSNGVTYLPCRKYSDVVFVKTPFLASDIVHCLALLSTNFAISWDSILTSSMEPREDRVCEQFFKDDLRYAIDFINRAEIIARDLYPKPDSYQQTFFWNIAGDRDQLENYQDVCTSVEQE